MQPFMRMVFGSPGAGKSTIAVRYAMQAIKQGIRVYSNFPIAIPGVYEINVKDIGSFDLSNSLVLIDEAGLEYNSRDYARFPKQTLVYFKMHRHYRTSFYFFSQGWDDCDKNIRTLCTQYYNIKKIGVFSLLLEFRKRVGLDNETHQIVDDFYEISPWNGGIKIIYRPQYYKYFDSFKAEKLPERESKKWVE